MEREFIEESTQLLDFIHKSPSPFHVVENIAQMLKEKGFEELCLKRAWDIKPGGKYYTKRSSSNPFSLSI